MGNKKINKMSVVIAISDEANFRCLLDTLSDRNPISKKSGNHSKVIRELMHTYFNKEYNKLTSEQMKKFEILRAEFLNNKNNQSD